MTHRFRNFSLRRVAAVAVVAALAVLGLPRDWSIGLPSALASACGTDSVLVYGPTKFIKTGSSSSWSYFYDTFNASPILGRRYVVEIVGSGVTQATVSIDGVQYVGSSEGTTLKRVIDVAASSNLTVALKGSSGTSLSLRVVHVSEPQYLVYGERTFTRLGTPGPDTNSFAIDTSLAGSIFRLRIKNGNGDGTSRVTNATVKVNGTQVASSSDFGSGVATVNKDVSIGPADTIEVNNQGASGSLMKVRLFATDRTPPVLSVAWPPSDTFYTDSSSTTIAGSATDAQSSATASVNGTGAYGPGAFTHGVTLSADGWYTETIRAVNGACETTTVVRRIARDTRAPTLDLKSPSADTTRTDSLLTLAGNWDDLTRTTVTVDGDTVGVGVAGAFAFSYSLDMGRNGILLRAVDALGHVTEFKRWVNRIPASETVRDSSTVYAADLSTTGVTSFYDAVKFVWKDTTGFGSKVQEGVSAESLAVDRVSLIRGRVFARDWGPIGNVEVRVLGHPGYGYTKTRNDGRFDLVVNGGGLLTLRFNKAGFLESQRSVEPLAGEYTLVDSVALVGRTAKSTTLDFSASGPIIARGRTASDANGDRDVRLAFKSGTVARIVTPSGDTTSFGTVRVRATEFTIGSSGLQSMPAVLPPGSAYTYCVDLSADEAEAIGSATLTSKPAPTTLFTKRVPLYVKEFMGLAAGTKIPFGFYDPQGGQWKAGHDAQVVKVISNTGATVTLDTDGDGDADAADSTALAALEVDGEELTSIASQFKSGESFWRGQVDHFTTWDLNFNLALVAQEASLAGGRAGSPLSLVEGSCTSAGSIIECENRVLGEAIPVAGTPFSLNYRSYRVAGDAAMRTLRIPVTGASSPPGIERILVRVEVAGRLVFDQAYTPSSNLVVPVTWDGLDAFNRRVVGSASARVSIGFQDSAKYAAGSGGSSFGRPGSSGGAAGVAAGNRATGRVRWVRQAVALGAPSMGSAGLGDWTLDPHHVFDPTGRGAVYFGDGSFMSGENLRPMMWAHAGNGQSTPTNVEVQKLATAIAANDLAIGPDGDLYVADGNRGAILRIDRAGIVHQLAGLSSPGDYNGDGEALSRRLRDISALAVAPDGSIYFALNSPGVLDTSRRVLLLKNGQVTTIISGATPDGYAHGENGPVAFARVKRPSGIALGSDGSLFVSDNGPNKAVFRVTPDGTFTLYAGGGGSAPSHGAADSAGKATTIKLSDPGQLATDRDGNLYVVDESGSLNRKVYKVAPDGMRTVFTVSSELGAQDCTFGPDGAMYITSALGGGPNAAEDRVWRRDPDGTLTSVAGGGPVHVEGMFAAANQLSEPHALAVGEDGTIYVQSSNDNYLYRISRTLGTRSASEISLPSRDGSEVYCFDLRGRHQYTRDALTGAVRFRFRYDGAGRLLTIYDVNGDSTRIERNGSGEPTAIIGPYGHTTTLLVDGNGHLKRVTNPAGEVTSLGPRASGLLDSLTDAAGGRYVFAYDGEGRLATDSDPTAATQTITNDSPGLTRTIGIESAEGRTTTYEVKDGFDGTRRRTVKPPGGQPYSTWSDSTDGVQRSWSPDRSSSTTTLRPGPRFGMFTPLPRIDEVLPDGQLRWTRHGCSVSTGFSPPDVHGTWRDTVTVNGRPWTTTFDSHPAARSLTTVTPVGRTTTATVDSAGRPLTLAVPGFATVTNHYDARGRLDYTTQSTRTWRYAYDDSGRIESITDPLSHVTTFRYDAADRLLVQLLPGGDSLRYGYEPRGNLASLKPPGKPAHAFAYTPVELTSAYDPPDIGGTDSTHYTYNGDRQLTAIERPDGAEVMLGYEAGTGRLGSITIPRGAVEFDYNGGTGTLHTIESPDGVTTTYTYDGPLPKTETWSGAISGSVAVTYDSMFAVKTQKVNDGSEVTFEYDHDGLLTHADPPGGAFTIARDGTNGTITGTTLGNVTTQQYLSAYGEPDSLVAKVSGGTLYRQVFGRDALGRVTTMTELLPDSAHSYDYEYDVRGRLTQVTRDGAHVQQLGYDGNGNRTTFTGASTADTASATYDAQDRLLRYRNTEFGWTAAGELAWRFTADAPSGEEAGPQPFYGDTTHFEYDELGNLLAVWSPGHDSVSYVIDGQNRRVGKKVNGTLVQGWLYQNGLNPIAELDSAGAVAARYVYGTRGHVPDYVLKGGAAYRVVTDHLGSVRLVVNASSGAVVERRDYDAWGNVTLDTSPTWLTLGYAGGIYDAATGLTRFGARDYDASVGRWTARDPLLSVEGEFNSYDYVASDPLNWIDPSGQSRDQYQPDHSRHGGPHVHRYSPKGKTVGRYRPDGSPITHGGAPVPPVPNSDRDKFNAAVKALLKWLERKGAAKACAAVNPIMDLLDATGAFSPDSVSTAADHPPEPTGGR